MADTFDYVLVGAGSAGSVIAGRIAQSGVHSVCVLEAGPPDTDPFIHVPAGFLRTIVNPKVNWLYETEPSAAAGGRRIGQPRGKTLGGSSSINGHVYSRGRRADYDGWAQAGNRGWGYTDVLPYFRRSERRAGGDDIFRGRDGTLDVRDSRWSHPLCEAFIDAAVAAGMPRNPDYNGVSQDGVSYTQRTLRGRRRMSAYRAFLASWVGRDTVDVRTAAHATGIVFEGRRARGVRYLRHGAEHVVHARREVVLCGGAINSPQLLQLSGIGPADLLAELGVPVVHALPGVGENLRDHFPVRITARVKNSKTINEVSRGLPLAMEIAKYALGRPSILELPPTLVYAFWHSDPATRAGDVQISFTPASYHEGVQNQLDTQPGMSLAAWQQRPESRGYVRARNRNPFEAPAIDPNYLGEDFDRRVLHGAIRLAWQLVTSKEMAHYFDAHNTPPLDVDSDAALDELIAARGTTAFHPMGTCRMGPDTDASAVVDDQLRVRGIEGLRVADASIMPSMPSCNTNAPTIMIGEKAADLILGRAPPEPATPVDEMPC